MRWKRVRRRRRVRPGPESGLPAIGWAEWIVCNGYWYEAPGPLVPLAVLTVGIRRLTQKLEAGAHGQEPHDA